MVVKQIYSLIEYDEAVKTMEAGADNIGLVPMQNGGVPAHRVPIERVHRIFDECKRRGVTSVAIMLTNDPDEMIELAREVRPDILHIAGDGYAADEAFAARLKEAAPNTKLMQAVLVDDESAVDRAKKYSQYCDLILTDSGLDAGPVTIAWHLEHEHPRAPSTSTIRRILHKADLITPEPKKRPKSSIHRFEADQPNETWQSDFPARDCRRNGVSGPLPGRAGRGR